jgi:stage II sporulation SpoAA-like protein
MLELIHGLPGNVVGIAVSGRLTRQDCEDLLVPAMQKSLRRHEKIRLYYELNSRFPGAAWDELDLGLEHAARCERVAIVTDIGWVRLTVKALRFLIPSEIRVFATIQADEGRAWIKGRREVRVGAETATSMPALTGIERRVRPSRPARTRPPLTRNKSQSPVVDDRTVARVESATEFIVGN